MVKKVIDYGFGIQLDGIKDDTDILRLFELRNKPEVWKWCRQRGPLHFDQHYTYWVNMLDPKQTHSKFYLIKNKGKIIGCAGFTSIDETNSRAEFSCYIDPLIQGVGFGESTLRTLFTFGFEMLNFNCIWGESFDGNPAMKLFEKIGMKKDGIRRQFYYREGKYIDAHLFSLLHEEWGRALASKEEKDSRGES